MIRIPLRHIIGALFAFAALTCAETAQAETSQAEAGDLEATAHALVGTQNTATTTQDTNTAEKTAIAASPQVTDPLTTPETTPDLVTTGGFAFPANAAALAALITAQNTNPTPTDPRNEACALVKELNPKAKPRNDCIGQ